MKFKTLLMTVVAGAAMLIACQPENLGPAQIKLNTTSISFGEGAGSQTVELTASRDWLVPDKSDWITPSVMQGEASKQPQTISISVTPNEGKDRKGYVVFSIGLSRFSLTVIQAGKGGGTIIVDGDGSKEKPFSVEQAAEAVKDLTYTDNNNYQKVGPFYVKGLVAAVTETFSADFGNGTFVISDDGTAEGAQLTAYRVLYLGNNRWAEGNEQVKVGDEVVIYGELMNYKGNTPETVQKGSYLYSLNGSTGGDTPGPEPGDITGTGTKDDPFNVAGAINAVKDLTWTSNTDYQKTDVLYVKGKISRIASGGTYGESGTYGNASFYISDNGEQGNEFYCFRILYLGNAKYSSGDDIKVGDDVVICGALMNYKGNTPETVSNESYLYSLNGNTGGDTPGPEPEPQPGDITGSGTQADPFNVPGALDAVKDLTWTSNTEYEKTDVLYVKGKISRIANKGTYGESGTYGNASFYISEDGSQSNEFYCFRVLYLGNVQYSSGTDIKVGDDVVICGALMNYKGNTPETVANEAYLYSLNGNTGGDTPGPEPEIKLIEVYDLHQTEDGFFASWEAINGTDYYYWELTYVDPTNEDADEDGFVYAATGFMDTGTTLNAIAGQFDDEDAEDAQFWEVDELEDGRTYYFAVMALQYNSDPQAESDYVLATTDPNFPSAFVAGSEPGPGPGPGPEPGEESTVTFNFDTATGVEITTNGAHYSTVLESITLDLESGARNQNSQDIRIYKNKVMTISSSAGNITKIVITSKGGDNGADKFGSGAPAGYSATATQGTWTGSSKSVSFTASGAQVRMTSIEVTYVAQ